MAEKTTTTQQQQQPTLSPPPTIFYILSSDSEPEPEPPFGSDFDWEEDFTQSNLDPIFSPYPYPYDDDDDNDDVFNDVDGQVSFFSNNNLFPENTNLINTNNDNNNTHLDLELGLALGAGSSNLAETRRFEGLRVVNIDSDSDTDEFVGFTDFDRPPFCWDYLGFNDENSNSSRAGPEREGVELGGGEIELASIVTEDEIERNDDYEGCFFFGDCHDGGDDAVELRVEGEGEWEREEEEISVLFERYGGNEVEVTEAERELFEVMVESEGEEEGGADDAIRDLEWEILLAVNNFNREVYDMDLNVDVYEAMLTEMEEHVNDLRGSPPTAESVIDSLPKVRLSGEGLEDGNVVCAVCKEEVMGEEVVSRLPCGHYYHGDCIVPWLKMRNTCPVCRRELPTDDAEYEHRKRQRESDREMQELSADSIVALSSQAGHDFHVFL